MRKELVGWKEIAGALGVTIRAAQRYAARERDALPCYRRLRAVHLDAAELEAWLDRHREPLADGAHERVVLVPADPQLAPMLRLFHRAAQRVLDRIASSNEPTVDPRQVTVDEFLAAAKTGGAAPRSSRSRKRSRR